MPSDGLYGPASLKLNDRALLHAVFDSLPGYYKTVVSGNCKGHYYIVSAALIQLCH